jgi:hypothetical protein
MQLARFIRALGLLMALGLVGSVVGCGAGAKKGTTAEDKAAGKAIIGAGFRKMRQQWKAEAAAKTAVNRKGNFRAKSGR